MDLPAATAVAPSSRNEPDPTTRPAGLRRAAGALAEAGRSPLSGVPEWCDLLDIRLRELGDAWSRHTETSEAEFFGQMRGDAPQVDPQLRQLHRDHDLVRASIAATRERLHELEQRGEVNQIQQGIEDLLMLLSRHEQRGSEVIHLAYRVDDGGGD